MSRIPHFSSNFLWNWTYSSTNQPTKDVFTSIMSLRRYAGKFWLSSQLYIRTRRHIDTDIDVDVDNAKRAIHIYCMSLFVLYNFTHHILLDWQTIWVRCLIFRLMHGDFTDNIFFLHSMLPFCSLVNNCRRRSLSARHSHLKSIT